jgi:hypothetical protein
MARKKGTIIYLSDEDKARLEHIALCWGVSQSSAMQRLIREHKLEVERPRRLKPHESLPSQL